MIARHLFEENREKNICFRFDPADFDNFHEGRVPEKKAGFAPTGYCDSKLINALFTRKLAGLLFVFNYIRKIETL